jgi:transcriptional regulator with XRE-family HTH domain
MSQETLAAQAGVSRSALRSLEAGTGSSLHTLVSLLRSLGREPRLDTPAQIKLCPSRAARFPGYRAIL